MLEKSQIAIDVKDVKKVYKLYEKRSDRVKDAFGLMKKNPPKKYHALNGVSMQIRTGETVGIIGTNGSGKSTILKIITGVLNATEGEVTVNGRISALLELGAGFNMEYNGIENVYLNGTMMGFSEKEIRARMDEIIEFSELEKFIESPVRTYSSGMYSKLAFSITAILETDIILIDEVLSVGDSRFKKKSYAKMKELLITAILQI